MVCYQESGAPLTSVTADGDLEIHMLVEQWFGDSVVTFHDPNHYAKLLVKNFEHLSAKHPVLVDLAPALKSHFLIGMQRPCACLSHLVMLWPRSMTYSVIGVKLHTSNEDVFCAHMCGFVLHVTDQSHDHCLHQPWPCKEHPALHPLDDAAAVEDLRVFIEGYLDDCQCYLHGYSTIQIELLNGTACK